MQIANVELFKIYLVHTLHNVPLDRYTALKEKELSGFPPLRHPPFPVIFRKI
jgi:hypothetical protein